MFLSVELNWGFECIGWLIDGLIKNYSLDFSLRCGNTFRTKHE